MQEGSWQEGMGSAWLLWSSLWLYALWKSNLLLQRAWCTSVAKLPLPKGPTLAEALVYIFRAPVSTIYLWNTIQLFFTRPNLIPFLGKYFTFQIIQIWGVSLDVCFILDWKLRSYSLFYLHFHLEIQFQSLICLQLFKENDLF